MHAAGKTRIIRTSIRLSDQDSGKEYRASLSSVHFFISKKQNIQVPAAKCCGWQNVFNAPGCNLALRYDASRVVDNDEVRVHAVC